LPQIKYWDHVALNCVAVWVGSVKDKKPFEEVLTRESNVKILTATLIEADPGSASKLVPPLQKILEVRRCGPAAGCGTRSRCGGCRCRLAAAAPLLLAVVGCRRWLPLIAAAAVGCRGTAG